MRIFWCVLALGLTLQNAAAQSPAKEAPITFAKERLILKPSEPHPTTLQANTLFYVNVRSASSLLNQDWFQLSGFKPNTGLLITYQESQIIHIEPANIYAHYDIIAANPYGEIILILPDIVLANLSEPITTPEPAAAVLYVASGTAAALSLKIGDHMEHRMFASRPKVIDAVTGANATPTITGININAPEILPSGNDIPAQESNGRRRPVGNPVITEPTPPKAPIVPKVDAPIAPSANKTNNPASQTNTNLAGAASPFSPAPQKPKTEYDFLNQILIKQ